MTGPLMLVLIAVLAIAALPRWPYSKSWGFFPSSLLGGILLILLILFFAFRTATG